MKIRHRLINTLLLCLIPIFLLAGEAEEKLLEAVRSSDVATVKQLLESGADVNTKFRYEITPLFYACDRGNVEIVQLLLDHGAEVNVKDTFYGATPVGWAAFNNSTGAVKLLLKHGAEGGGDVLNSAVAQDNTEMIDAVLESGKASAEMLSKALESAEASGKSEIAEILKKAGAVLPDTEIIELSPEQLAVYPGKYKNAEQGFEMSFEMDEGKLRGVFGGQPPLTYKPVDTEHNFTSVEFQGIDISFKVADDKASGFTLKQGSFVADFTRAEIKQGSETTAATEKEAAEENAKPAEEMTIKTGAALVDEAINWPSFRGTNASGIADGQHPPVKWNGESGENIKWKTAVPGFAHSCPVIWDDKMFIATAVSSDTGAVLRVGLYGDVKPDADVSEHEWKVYCLDKNTGEVIWERTSHKGVPKIMRHTKASQSNSTPVTNGEYIVALFGAEGMYCYDMDGNLAWKKDLGFLDAGWFFDPDYQWGHGSSPIIYKDMVIVQCDEQKNSFIAAYRLKDGSEVWRTDRDEIPSWATPTVYTGESGAELLTNATNGIRAYNPDNGETLWTLNGSSEIAVPTPIFTDDLIYITNGYRPIKPIYAIRPGNRGDISLADGEKSNEHIAWSYQRGGPYMPTPIVYDGYFYTCANNGTVVCYNAETGEQLYKQRLGGRGSGYGFTASPLAADGRLYFTSEDGEIYIVKAGPEYKLIAVNEIGEVCMATPAISNGMLFVRAQNHVYGIGD